MKRIPFEAWMTLVMTLLFVGSVIGAPPMFYYLGKWMEFWLQ